MFQTVVIACIVVLARSHVEVKCSDNVISVRNSQANLMRDYMDATADPCNNFYQYACGNWKKYNSIPEDQPKLDELLKMKENMMFTLKALLELRNNEETDDPEDAISKVKDFYFSCVNETKIEERGIGPLHSQIRQLGGWPAIDKQWNADNFNWVNTTAQIRLLGQRVMFDSYVYEDIRSSSDNIMYIDDPFLGLDNRDSFFSDTNEFKGYKNFIQDVLELLGCQKSELNKEVDDIVNFERKLASFTASLDEKMQFNERYNRITVGDLSTLFPIINWQQYLSIIHERNISDTESVVLMSKTYLTRFSDFIRNTQVRTIANYLLWRFVQTSIDLLGDRFRVLSEKFKQAISGSTNKPLRWKLCVDQAMSNMGMAVSALYVRSNFKNATRTDFSKLTKKLKDSFRKSLKRAKWLDPTSKALAEEKLDAMRVHIGYPDFILSSTKLNDYYRSLETQPDTFFENVLSTRRYETIVQRNKLGKKNDKNEWLIPPASASAMYEFTKQRLIITAAILNPPFYHRHLPKFFNFAGIGVVAGHEMMHGFDNVGAGFDANGNLRTWWSNSSMEAFTQRANCFIEQYNNYNISGLPVIGKNVQGEAIADNGGLRQAFIAYETWLDNNKNKAILQNEFLPEFNLTNKQMFFLSFAQLHCSEIRPEALVNILQTDSHAPGKYRVIGPLSNFDEFSREFNCPKGSPMNPRNKCKIW